MIKNIDNVLDKYKNKSILLDIRENKVLAFDGTEFIFDADKVGEFWYIKIDKYTKENNK